jgi:uncharacterized protein YjiS (DUF1127 family)
MTARDHPAARPPSGSPPASLATALDPAHWFKAWLERRRQRRVLAALDGRALRDIGLTCGDVARDAAEARAMLSVRMRQPV